MKARRWKRSLFRIKHPRYLKIGELFWVAENSSWTFGPYRVLSLDPPRRFYFEVLFCPGAEGCPFPHEWREVLVPRYR